MRRQSDTLITGAFSETDSRQNPLPDLRVGAARLGQAVADCWSCRSEYLAESLRAAGVLACLPSLETIAASKSHDVSVAEATSENFRQLASNILSTPRLSNPHAQELKHDPRLSTHVRGQMSEIGILGVLWWSISTGRRDPQTYALPTTHAEDYGRRKDGYNLGADIAIRQNGSRKAKQLIQVKTSRDIKRNGAKLNRYYPGIAVVALSDVLQPRQPGDLPRRLLGVLASGNNRQLDEINQRIDTRIRKARETAELHSAYKAREIARQSR